MAPRKKAITVQPGVLNRDVYSVKELSIILGLNHEAIQNLIRVGRLKAIFIGGSAGYRILHQDVMEFLSKDSTQPPVTNPDGHSGVSPE